MEKREKESNKVWTEVFFFFLAFSSEIEAAADQVFHLKNL